MKKHAVAIAVVALGASVLATAALASTLTLFSFGTVTGAPDSKVAIQVLKKNRKPIAIRSFTAREVRAHCDGGAGTVSQRFSKRLPLDAHRRFSGEVRSSGGPGGFFKLSGRVKPGGFKAAGTLSIDRSFDPPLGECKTGTKSWSTHAYFPPD